MARYAPQEEQIFVVGGRAPDGGLVIVDPRTGEALVSNPPACLRRNPAGGRRAKREVIELPLGQYEDLRVRVGLVRSSARGKYPTVAIGSSRAVADLMAPFSNDPQEVVSVVLLDTRNVVIGIHEVHRGGLTSAAVEPQSVFKAAVVANAPAVIIVHNHPSGDPTPSPDDKSLAVHLSAASEVLGVRMLDFVVIGQSSYTSFADRGWL